RHRVDLFSGGTPYVPDPEEREAPQFRHHAGSENAVKTGVAEHGGHVDSDRQQEALHGRGIVEELALKLGDTMDLFGADALPDPALEAWVGVIPEIKPIALEHRLQEKMDLQGLKVAGVWGWAHAFTLLRRCPSGML